MTDLRNKLLAGLVASTALLSASAAVAAPILVDFEGFTSTNTSFAMGGPLTLGAALFNSAPGSGNIEGPLRFAPNNTENGTARYMHQVGTAFTLDTVDGSLFSLTSFAIAERRIDNGFQAVSTTVIGTYGAGGTITATFTNSAPGFQTFSPGPGWTGLTLVSFANPGFANCTPDCMYYDNILLNSEPMGAPAPGALAVLGVGLAGLGAARRRKAA